MAIKKVGTEAEDKVTVEIDNGDFQALKSIQENYNFANKESLLRFALAALLKSGKKGLYVEEDNGAKTKLLPNDALTTKPTPPAQG